MEFAKGVATGFVIGVVVIGTAAATLYVHDDSVHERNSARIEELDEHVQRLERAVATLSGRVADELSADRAAATTAASLTTVTGTARDEERIR